MLADVFPIYDPSTGIHFAASAIFALATGETVPLQTGLRAILRNGAEIAVEGEISPGSSDGPLAGYVVLTIRDATARHALIKAEESRERAALVGRLTNGVARQIGNSLGELPRLIDQLQTVTPGNAVPVMDELRRRVDTLAGASRKLTEMIRVQTVPLESFDVNRLFTEPGASWRAALPHAAALSLKTDRKLPRVKASAAALDLVLRELVENACEAMHPFPASVEIESECIELPPQTRSASPETYVVITVRDWGPGIESTIRGQIFDPYFTTRAEQNRGLGLAVAAEIVSGLGGFIEGQPCESGFAFHVYLPARRSARLPLPNY